MPVGKVFALNDGRPLWGGDVQLWSTGGAGASHVGIRGMMLPSRGDSMYVTIKLDCLGHVHRIALPGG